jgi:hypothetical protein
LSFRTAKRVHGRDVTTREEMFQREADIVGLNGTRVRLFVFLAIQVGMFIVAKQAYGVYDDPTAPITQLSLYSNLNQIGVTAALAMLAIWELRDLTDGQKIDRMASFVPPRKAASRI